MSFHRTADGIRLHYRLEGRPGAPLLILGNSLGTDLFMWDSQIDALMAHFRVLRYDVRGHGASDVAGGDTTMAVLGGDVLALADHAGAQTFAYVGLSLGAMTGLWLAMHAPQRLTRIVLSNAAPHLPSHESWSARMALARKDGMPALLDMVMPRFFSQAYRDRDEPAYHSMRTSFAAMAADGYAACCAAIRDTDFRADLPNIRTPVLVISGSQDAATPHEAYGAQLVQGIPGAQSAVLDAGHIANVEQPRAFNRAVIEFLTRPSFQQEPSSMPHDKLYEDGMKVRRHILGNEHVDRASARTTDVNREFQELIIRYGWGEVWTRPGLDYRERRILVLGTMMGLGRWEEFRMHLRAALVGQMSINDIKEVFLQQAIYCGVPIANTAHHHLEEIIAELQEKGVKINGL